MNDWLTHVVTAVVGALLGVLGVGQGPAPGHERPHQPTATLGAPTALQRLAVAPDTNADTYRRDYFGRGWADLDHDGCNTREEVMARDLRDVTKADDGCNVLAGTLVRDRYTGARIVYSESDPQRVQIDHVVALSDAWRSGAYAWDPERRLAYANDPFVLWAVDGHANIIKSGKGPDQWEPTNDAYRCAYERRYVQIKYKWHLSVTRSEHAILSRDLEECR